MKKILTLMMLIMAVAFSATAKGETVQAVFNIQPGMTCQNCENKIKTNMRYESGVTAIVTDRQAQTVTITFNPSKTNTDKLIAAFKKIGYTATLAMPKPAAQQCQPSSAGCGACGGCGHHK